MAQLASDFSPIAVLEEKGGLSASIFRCQGKQGIYFTTTFSRIFRYRGQLYMTDRFRHEQLLALAHLAERSYERIKRLESLYQAPDVNESQSV